MKTNLPIKKLPSPAGIKIELEKVEIVTRLVHSCSIEQLREIDKFLTVMDKKAKGKVEKEFQE